MLKAVLDTNVVVAGKRSQNPESPNLELLNRWLIGEFVWMVSPDILEEYAETLLEKGEDPNKITAFIHELIELAETVPIRFFHVRHYPAGPNDVPFLLTVSNGQATHLVTYDGHLEEVGVFYPEFRTCQPVAFLTDLRNS